MEAWYENPYWEYFCGVQFSSHELPCMVELHDVAFSAPNRRARC
ncbi:hypothetical protein J5X90_03175 [Pseudoalteromonas viridis]|uniref:Transposase InsH N-terminal domain-containing protein n=1 Tax=Pseudoalteromonas viridis TaxID=339617 RepID=A0ABX7V5A8_9GAMM|nr:hypothetical protein J5X90_03175 [Pseudoalteromonas viridis]